MNLNLFVWFMMGKVYKVVMYSFNICALISKQTFEFPAMLPWLPRCTQERELVRFSSTFIRTSFSFSVFLFDQRLPEFPLFTVFWALCKIVHCVLNFSLLLRMPWIRYQNLFEKVQQRQTIKRGNVLLLYEPVPMSLLPFLLMGTNMARF